MSITVNINGEQFEIDAPDGMPLLWVLRDRLGLTGTKYGCGIAQCGACTVHVNGKPQRACVTPVSSLGDAEVTTIEALEGPEARAVRKAWEAIDVPQCGYCQAGQVMSAVALLRNKAAPSDEDIDKAMDANLCRCATYVRIRRAIKDAASNMD